MRWKRRGRKGWDSRWGGRWWRLWEEIAGVSAIVTVGARTAGIIETTRTAIVAKAVPSPFRVRNVDAVFSHMATIGIPYVCAVPLFYEQALVRTEARPRLEGRQGRRRRFAGRRWRYGGIA